MPPASDQSDSSMSGRFIPSHPAAVHCRDCGHENPPSHKFCGACGAPLEDDGVRSPSRIDDHDSAERGSGTARDERAGHDEPAVAMSSKAYADGQVFEDSITNPSELSLFRSFRPADSTDDPDYDEPGFRRYRVYVGGLTVALIVLGYMVWHSSRATSQGAPQAPLRPPAAATETSQPAPTRDTTAHDAPRSSTIEPKAAAKNAIEAQRSAKTTNGDVRGKTGSAAGTNSPTDSPEASQGQSSASNGDEELTMAQRYLDGKNGQGRDSVEAAKWLWKSIAKHNSAATVLLADLYLKGDGVSKNCDQARVLLDSAARKGFPPAAERLRNLQAFGCQ